MSLIIPTTRIIIPNLEGKILLLKRASNIGKNKWNLPGGKVETGEFIYETSRKETKEETNLDLNDMQALFYSESPVGTDGRHYLTFYQLALNYTGKIKLNEESSEYSWIDPKTELDNYDIAFGNDLAIRIYYKIKD